MRSRRKQGGRRSSAMVQAFGKNWQTDGFTPPKTRMVGVDPMTKTPIMAESGRGERKRLMRAAMQIRIAIEQATISRYCSTIYHGAQLSLNRRFEAPHMIDILKPIKVFTLDFIYNTLKSGTAGKLLKGFEDIVARYTSGGGWAAGPAGT